MKLRKHGWQFNLIVCCWLVVLAVPVRAQITTGTVIGQVRDQTGQPVPDVIVTIINVHNRNKRATRTNDNGNYVIPNLPPGTYHIIATRDGYFSQCIASFQVLFNKTNSVKYPPNFILPKQSGAGNNPSCQTLLGQRVATGDFAAVFNDRSAPIQPQDWRSFSFKIQPVSFFPEASVNAQATIAAPAKITEGNEASGLVNLADVARSSNITEQQLNSLPLGAASYLRSFDELALLAPGVAPPPYTPGVRGPGVGFGIGSAGQFSVNGMRARSNNFSIDGTDNNDPDVGVRRGGYVAQALQAVGSVEEISIATLLWSAEVGRNFGSQVNAVSKYGGTNYHGQVEGFFTDARMHARDFFDYQGGASRGKNPFTRTQAGANLSGPLLNQRTQFFFGFEGSKTNAALEEHFAAPAPPAPANLDREPTFLLRFPCPKNGSYYICLTYGLPSAQPLRYYPDANNLAGPFGLNTYSRELPADGEGMIESFRLTQQIAAAHSLNATYGFTEDRRVLPSVNQAINSTLNAKTRSQNLSLIFASQLRSQVFNQARFSFGRTRIRFPEHALGPFDLARFDSRATSHSCEYPIDNVLNDSVCPSNTFFPFTQIVGEITVAPFSPVGINTILFPQGRINNNFQFANTTAWHKRNHLLKGGGDVRRVQFNNFQDRLYRPQLRYGYGVKETGNLEFVREPNQTNYRFTPTGRMAATSLDLAMLFPTSTLQTLTAGTPDSHISLRLTESLFFFTDTWQLRPRLTFVTGLRFEYTSVPHDAGRRIEDALALRNLPQPTASNTAQERTRYESVINAYAQVLGGRQKMYDPDANNFGPHFGVAWGMGNENKTALRAGYGMYYDAILGALISQSRNLFPRQIPVGIDRPRAGALDFPASCQTVLCERVEFMGTAIKTNQLKGDFVSNVATLSDQISAGLAFSLPAKNLPTPYAQQWHVTLEREFKAQTLVSVGYVGTLGRKLTRIITPNLGAENTPFVQHSSGIIYYKNFNEPATAKAILLDTASLLRPPRPTPEIGSYQIFENAAASSYHALQIEATKRYGKRLNYTLAYTWSHALDEVSDIFPISGAPVIAQSQLNPRAERGNANFDLRHRFASSVMWDLPKLKGWQLAAIAQAQTGQPFTLNLPIDANLDGNLSDRPATLQGVQLVPGHQREKVRLASGVTLNDFLALGKDGVVGRNTLRGDSFLNLDVALAKTFRFTEQRNLVFKAEVFNLFNRANFGLPVRTLDAPGFGAAVATVNPARRVQLALKLRF